MVTTVTPTELGLKGFDLCPAVNIGGCPDNVTIGPVKGQRLFTVAHAHAPFTKGYQYSNNICVAGWSYMDDITMTHEYGHVVAQLLGHGEFWDFVVSQVLGRPDVVKKYRELEAEFPGLIPETFSVPTATW